MFITREDSHIFPVNFQENSRIMQDTHHQKARVTHELAGSQAATTTPRAISVPLLTSPESFQHISRAVNSKQIDDGKALGDFSVA